MDLVLKDEQARFLLLVKRVSLKPSTKGAIMQIIDFRSRPSIQDAARGMRANRAFAPMLKLFAYADWAKAEPIEKIVADIRSEERR